MSLTGNRCVLYHMWVSNGVTQQILVTSQIGSSNVRPTFFLTYKGRVGQYYCLIMYYTENIHNTVFTNSILNL